MVPTDFEGYRTRGPLMTQLWLTKQIIYFSVLEGILALMQVNITRKNKNHHPLLKHMNIVILCVKRRSIVICEYLGEYGVLVDKL